MRDVFETTIDDGVLLGAGRLPKLLTKPRRRSGNSRWVEACDALRRHFSIGAAHAHRAISGHDCPYEPEQPSPLVTRGRPLPSMPQPLAVFASLWISSLQMLSVPNPDEEVPDGSI
jgi:hypothetical protein